MPASQLVDEAMSRRSSTSLILISPGAGSKTAGTWVAVTAISPVSGFGID
jgi:hypothetical protein